MYCRAVQDAEGQREICWKAQVCGSTAAFLQAACRVHALARPLLSRRLACIQLSCGPSAATQVTKQSAQSLGCAALISCMVWAQKLQQEGVHLTKQNKVASTKYMVDLDELLPPGRRRAAHGSSPDPDSDSGSELSLADQHDYAGLMQQD